MKKYFQKLLESAFMFFLAAYFVKVAACFLYSVWPVLAVIGAILILVIIFYRIIKHKRDSGKW